MGDLPVEEVVIVLRSPNQLHSELKCFGVRLFSLVKGQARLIGKPGSKKTEVIFNRFEQNLNQHLKSFRLHKPSNTRCLAQQLRSRARPCQE